MFSSLTHTVDNRMSSGVKSETDFVCSSAACWPPSNWIYYQFHRPQSFTMLWTPPITPGKTCWTCRPALVSCSPVGPCMLRVPPPRSDPRGESHMRSSNHCNIRCVSASASLGSSCCITWTQGKVLNEVLWRASHVYISGGGNGCADAPGFTSAQPEVVNPNETSKQITDRMVLKWFYTYFITEQWSKNFFSEELTSPLIHFCGV